MADFANECPEGTEASFSSTAMTESLGEAADDLGQVLFTYTLLGTCTDVPLRDQCGSGCFPSENPFPSMNGSPTLDCRSDDDPCNSTVQEEIDSQGVCRPCEDGDPNCGENDPADDTGDGTGAGGGDTTGGDGGTGDDTGSDDGTGGDGADGSSSGEGSGGGAGSGDDTGTGDGGSSGEGSGGGTGTGTGSNGDGDGRASSGGLDCSEAPLCEGDQIDCQAVFQQWSTRCLVENAGSEIPLLIAAAGGDPLNSDTPLRDAGLVEEIDLNEDIDLSGLEVRAPAGSCPSSQSVSVAGGSFTIDFQPFCETCGYVSTVVQIGAIIFSSVLIIRAIGTR